MSETLSLSAAKPALSARFLAHPVVRMVIGLVLTLAPLPLTMMLAHNLVAKPYRFLWPQLLAALFSFLAYRFFVQRVEKRELTEFATQGAVRQVVYGLLLGAGLVCSVFALLAVQGSYHLDGVGQFSLRLLVPLAELLLVGLTEEMLMRGVVFGVSERAWGSRWAVVISSALFALSHLPNDGAGFLAMAAIAVDGVLQAALYIRTRRLWICVANHIAWNYCVGQVFSSTVSGHGAETGLLQGHLSGPVLFTGGDFGVEASLATLVVIMVVAAYFLRSVVVRRLLVAGNR